MTTYVIARTARQRPTLMHIIRTPDHAGHLAAISTTRCGTDISGWSRAYFHDPIPQVLCLRCALREP